MSSSSLALPVSEAVAGLDEELLVLLPLEVLPVPEVNSFCLLLPPPPVVELLVVLEVLDELLSPPLSSVCSSSSSDDEPPPPPPIRLFVDIQAVRSLITYV